MADRPAIHILESRNDPGWRPDHPITCSGTSRCTLVFRASKSIRAARFQWQRSAGSSRRSRFLLRSPLDDIAFAWLRSPPSIFERLLVLLAVVIAIRWGASLGGS